MQATMPRVDDEGEELPTESDSDQYSENEGEDSLKSTEAEGSEFDFGESDDDILDSDADFSEDVFLDPGTIADSLNEEWEGVEESASLQKRKISGGALNAENHNGNCKKRRKLKHLPTFASLAEYENLIDQTPEDNI